MGVVPPGAGTEAVTAGDDVVPGVLSTGMADVGVATGAVVVVRAGLAALVDACSGLACGRGPGACVGALLVEGPIVASLFAGSPVAGSPVAGRPVVGSTVVLGRVDAGPVAVGPVVVDPVAVGPVAVGPAVVGPAVVAPVVVGPVAVGSAVVGATGAAMVVLDDGAIARLTGLVLVRAEALEERARARWPWLKAGRCARVTVVGRVTGAEGPAGAVSAGRTV